MSKELCVARKKQRIELKHDTSKHPTQCIRYGAFVQPDGVEMRFQGRAMPPDSPSIRSQFKAVPPPYEDGDRYSWPTAAKFLGYKAASSSNSFRRRTRHSPLFRETESVPQMRRDH